MRNPTREQLQTNSCSTNNCMKQAEDESAKVEGQPESEQRTKFHPLLSLQLQADIFHLLRKFSDEEEKDDTPEQEVNLSALHECFLQKKRRLLEESSHSLRSLKVKCLKSIQGLGKVLTLDTFTNSPLPVVMGSAARLFGYSAPWPMPCVL